MSTSHSWSVGRIGVDSVVFDMDGVVTDTAAGRFAAAEHPPLDRVLRAGRGPRRPRAPIRRTGRMTSRRSSSADPPWRAARRRGRGFRRVAAPRRPVRPSARSRVISAGGRRGPRLSALGVQGAGFPDEPWSNRAGSRTGRGGTRARQLAVLSGEPWTAGLGCLGPPCVDLRLFPVRVEFTGTWACPASGPARRGGTRSASPT